MTEKSLPIVRPYHPRLGSFATEFNRALQTGVVTNNGPHVQEFESALTHILGAPTLAFNNGMSALIAMLMACDVKGMEVICPSFTFAATPHAVVMAGGIPVFADIDPDTLCLDAEDVERRITPRTTAILGVDPYGICWEPPDRWMTGELDILIDSAPSFGSMNQDGHPSTRGHAQIYSFHATKPFSTMEGGALCSRNATFMAKAAAIRNFGQGPDGECQYVGFNGKMTEISAIVGMKSLETWQYRAGHREDSAIRLRRALRGISGLRIMNAPEGTSPIWTYQPVFVQPEFGKSRDEVAAGLIERGVMVRKYYGACHLMPAYHNDFVELADDKRLPITERLASQVIALPVYDEMTDAEIGQIAQALRDIGSHPQCEPITADHRGEP